MTKWRKYNGALIPDQPPHIGVDDSNNLIKKKISSNNAYFSRWITHFDCKEETDFWYIICDEFTPIELLSSNTRNNVRRGLKRCRIEMVDVSFIIKNCYSIYKAAFDNYHGHLSPISEREFEEEYSLYTDTKVWDFWVVYENETDQVIAYTRNKIEYNQCELCTTKFHPNFQRKLYPSEALFYSMNEYYLQEMNFDYINDGARSISHETNIQYFLMQKFKFRKAFCKLNIIYSTHIGFLVKLLYPFRVVLKSLNFGPFTKVNVLLKQEKIRRSYA
tara:strand:+ start:815 stop:1639 length:825 start_codon:yes stop_codon:yes gene_type:complete